MNAKKVTTLLLLLFVAASVGTIVVKERNALPAAQKPETASAAPVTSPQEAAPEKAQATAAPEATAPVKVVAYYFHGNFRCAKCRMIEALTTEAIQTGFAEDIKNGRVELKVVNIEEPGNEHYAEDYQLATRSVVVARYEGAAQKDWKRLDAVWELLGDKDAFIRMVQGETNVLLKGKN
ncbi:MAG: nitrophenyl compound nitroreductase subunit ArsF family protein [Alphaproteobacteria bacterium]|nr:nitrophenyl compound nitroreductase subunit ArsF family protein [Alphaproteobacteria bacterium]